MKVKYIFKVIVVGDVGVGKSNLMWQFSKDKFFKDHESTVGVDFSSRAITLSDNTPVHIQVFDTAGQERYKSITLSYFRGAAGCLLVYDITRRETFEHVETWLSLVREKTHQSKMILIGNKCDLDHKREITSEQGQTLAQRHGLLFLETSAKTAHHVHDAFLQLGDEIFRSLPLDEESSLGVKKISMNDEPPAAKKCGC
jgi:Ras-related protein Rab-2A